MSASPTAQKTGQEISFDRFPLWQGVFDHPTKQRFYPYRLGMHERGYICQQSGAEVQAKIVDAYNASDYSMPTKPPGASPWANWLGDLYIAFAEEHIPSFRDKRVMEIGAGSFYLAKHFVADRSAARYVIVDPSLKEAADNPKIRVIREYFDDDLDLHDEKTDVMISLNTLEHVEDPYAFLVKARSQLSAQNGSFVLVFPDIETQFCMGDYNALCFEHLNYFSERSANRLIKQAGFRIAAFKKELDTLFYVLEVGGEPEARLPDENDKALLSYAAARYKNGLDATVARIRKAQSDGKKIALHGACNGLNTLFALGDFPEENIVIFDGDESKAGTYVPSSSIPCVVSTSPLYREMDLVIVVAVTFYKQIHSFLTSHHGIAEERILPICSLSTESRVPLQ